MTHQDIADIRLNSMQLLTTTYRTPEELVTYMGAMQAQDYLSAQWAIGSRLKRIHDGDIDQALAQGSIIRTHILRPTWHFVSQDNFRWIQSITSDRVHKFNAYYYRKVGLTDEIRMKARTIVEKVLANNTYMTRDELREHFTQSGITQADNLFTIHILMALELDSILCSGPRRGKQFTYALVEERVPTTPALSRDEGLATLALRYYTSHGPATIQDLVWWSGLTVSDVKKSIEILKHKLVSYQVDGLTYYAASQLQKVSYTKPFVLLQPAYDEYTVAYKNHEAHFPAIFKREELGYGYFMLINGQISGIWKREVKKNAVQVSISPFRKLTSEEDLAVYKEAERFGAFLRLPVSLT